MRARNLFLIILTAMSLGGCRQTVSLDGAPALTEVIRPEVPLTLIFSGDVMQHMPQITSARQSDGSYNYDPCFQFIAPFWKSGDFTVVNLETTLSQTGPYSGYPCFSAPASLAGSLKRAGVDVVAFANNHTCDRGANGIRKTLAVLDSLGLPYLGVYTDTVSSELSQPVMLEKDRFRVAVLNYTYGTNGLPVPKGMVVNHIDTVLIRRHIEHAREKQASHIVAFYHWGEEYRLRPEREMVALAEWSRDNGIDVVIGSHPHVVQSVETERKIAYSLGNFVSNQRERHRDAGLSIRLTLTHVGEPVLEYLPHWVWNPYRNGKKAYYAVPAGIPAEVSGMDSVEWRRFNRALEDVRRVAGADGELEWRR